MKSQDQQQRQQQQQQQTFSDLWACWPGNLHSAPLPVEITFHIVLHICATQTLLPKVPVLPVVDFWPGAAAVLLVTSLADGDLGTTAAPSIFCPSHCPVFFFTLPSRPRQDGHYDAESSCRYLSGGCGSRELRRGCRDWRREKEEKGKRKEGIH